MIDRHLDWDGCFNVRDLGGLCTADGTKTRWGAVVRADSIAGLTNQGWEDLSAHGVRTAIDLRNDDECAADVEARPNGITNVQIALDGNFEDGEFWKPWMSGPQFGTPLYYRPFLERFPQRTASVISEIAQGLNQGAVLFHCHHGRDRTGLIALLLLALVGVPANEIANDYLLSPQRLDPLYASQGTINQTALIEEFYISKRTSPEVIIQEILESVNVEDYLLSGGVTATEIATLRAHLACPQQERNNPS